MSKMFNTTPQVFTLKALGCQLGEGLHWDARRQLLWLVDILRQQVIWFDLEAGKIGQRHVPEPIGWILTPEASNLVLVGMQSGIALVDPFDDASPIEWVDRSFPGQADMRLNDGKVDRFGRVWSGSMVTDPHPSNRGVLACYSFRGKAWQVIDNGYSIPNGPAFNEDGSIMLHSDSAQRTVFRYELDEISGHPGRRKIWRWFTKGEGLPDGMTFDSEGCVWIAHWGAGCVSRYASSGDLIMKVPVPTSHVTNVCFGGEFLDRIFVSSARYGALTDDPNAGSLFEIHGTGVRGLRPPALHI